MILDTTFLVDVLRGDAVVRDAIEIVDEQDHVSVSTVTVMELWDGVRRVATSEREREATIRLLSEIREVPFDGASARVAGDVAARLAANGTPIESTDVMIAATAIARDVPVVTRNVDHFERVEELSVLTY